LQAGGHRFDPGHVHHFYWENRRSARLVGCNVTGVLPYATQNGPLAAVIHHPDHTRTHENHQI